MAGLHGETLTREEALDGRTYRLINCPLRNPDGSISRVLTVRFDVTEERHIESELRERDSLVSALMEQFRRRSYR